MIRTGGGNRTPFLPVLETGRRPVAHPRTSVRFSCFNVLIPGFGRNVQTSLDNERGSHRPPGLGFRWLPLSTRQEWILRHMRGTGRRVCCFWVDHVESLNSDVGKTASIAGTAYLFPLMALRWFNMTCVSPRWCSLLARSLSEYIDTASITTSPRTSMAIVAPLITAMARATPPTANDVSPPDLPQQAVCVQSVA